MSQEKNDAAMKDRMKTYIEEGINDDYSSDRNSFENFSPFEIEHMEGRDFRIFYQEQLQGKRLSFRDLTIKVLEHFLVAKRRVIYPSEFAFDQKEIFGPNPMLYFRE